MTWLRKHPNAVAFALLAVVAALSLCGVQREGEIRRRELCEALNEQSAILADLIEASLQGSGGGGLPLTELPSFPKLDHETQQWVIELEALVQRGSDSPSDLEQRLREFKEQRLTPADCSNA